MSEPAAEERDVGRSLLERAGAGDQDAFVEFVRLYEVRVAGVVRRLLDDERDLEEVVQDVFVQAWRNLDRYRGEASVFTWLYRIATNQALMKLRRKQLQLVDIDDAAAAQQPQTPPSPAPAERAEAAELRAFVAERIRELPFEYRAALVLRDIEGLSNEEVAETLEISLPAAKSRIHRARMQLREQLQQRERPPT